MVRFSLFLLWGSSISLLLVSIVTFVAILPACDSYKYKQPLTATAYSSSFLATRTIRRQRQHLRETGPVGNSNNNKYYYDYCKHRHSSRPGRKNDKNEIEIEIEKTDDCHYRNNNNTNSNSSNNRKSLDRRSFLWALSSPPSFLILVDVLSSLLVDVGGVSVSSQLRIGVAAANAAVANESVAPSAAPSTTRAKEKDIIHNKNKHNGNGFSLSDEIVESLVYERILGSGSYKTVYLVSATIPKTDNDNGIGNGIGIGNGNGDETRTVRYALAVERLRNKRDVKNAFRGVRIPDLIRQGLDDDSSSNNNNNNSDDGDLFETIVDWWVQPSNVPEYAQGRRIFPATATTKVVDLDKIGRTRSEPRKNFVGSRWMLSFKPVYETDLKQFIRDTPVLFPVVDDNDCDKNKNKDDQYIARRSRDDTNKHELLLPTTNTNTNYWTEPVLLKFVLEILHAGKIMHEAGIVHRDIKPKNMMISLSSSSSSSGSSPFTTRRRPVIIDYGFSEVGSPILLLDGGGGQQRTITTEKLKDICVVHPGQLKGEVDYVLAEDLANYRGCQRGDAYAMGKTLYEFVFGSADELLLQQQQQKDQEQKEQAMTISVDEAFPQNEKFRNLLFDDNKAGNESRFHSLSRGAADCLLSIMRGLCSTRSALSFAEAEEILSEYLVLSLSSSD